MKRLRRIKKEGFADLSRRDKRGQIILKIFLEMEWIWILGVVFALAYAYLVVIIGRRLFGLKNL